MKIHQYSFHWTIWKRTVVQLGHYLLAPGPMESCMKFRKSTKYFGSFKAKQRCSVLLNNWSSWRLDTSCWSHFIEFFFFPNCSRFNSLPINSELRLKVLLLLSLFCLWLRPWLPRSRIMLHSYSVIYVAYMSALPSPDALLMLKHAAHITLHHTDSYSSYLLGVDGHV